MKKLLAVILMISLILPTTFMGYADESMTYQEFIDIEGHWAEETIKKHHKMGMLRGYPDGSFQPDQQMKRSELITLVNKYFGLKGSGEENFKDVKGKEWYAAETAKAKYYGYIKDLEARPEDFATRIDVIRMMNLIIDVEEQRQVNEKKEFKDLEGLDEAEKESIVDFSQMGYVSGYEDGTFQPKEIINRAEIMTMVENVLGYIVTSQEDMDNMPEDVKKVTIINPNIIIEDKAIKGDLYISPGANGKVTIKNTKIDGQIEISGGTIEAPIQLENVEVEKIIVTKAKETPKVQIKGKSKITQIKTKSEVDLEITDETEIDEIQTKAKTKLTLKEKTTVKTLIIEEETEVDTDDDIEINEVQGRNKAVITGKGTIKKAIIYVDDVEIERRPEYIRVEDDKKVKVGKKEITEKNDDYGNDDSRNRDKNKDDDDDEPTNRAPKAKDDTAKVKKNGAVIISVLRNDRDEDGDALRVATVTEAVYGKTEIKDETKIKYTPNKDYLGEDEFRYTISDGEGGQDTAKVIVTVVKDDIIIPPTENHDPVAKDDRVETSENQEIIISVLRNDRDEDGDVLKVATVTEAVYGKTEIKDETKIKYTPNKDYFGEDEFRYTISDGEGGQDTAKVIVTVVKDDIIIPPIENHPPVAKDDDAQVDEDQSVLIDVLENDIDADDDPLTVIEVVYANHGEVSIKDNKIQYVPDKNYYGEDSFEYTIQDIDGETSEATVNITVHSVNDIPVISEKSLIVDEITQNSAAIHWTKATDVDHEQEELMYGVYYAEESFNTIKEIEDNATLAGEYEKNISDKSIDELKSGTTYYFYVIVKDPEDGKNLYAGKVITTKGIQYVRGIKPLYQAGENLDLSNLEVKLIKSDGSFEEVSFAQFEEKGIATDLADNILLNVKSNKLKIYMKNDPEIFTIVSLRIQEMEGTGEENDPFMINSIEDLIAVGRGLEIDGIKDYDLDKYYKLEKDLDFISDDSYQDKDISDFFDVNEDYDTTEQLKDALKKDWRLSQGFKPIGGYGSPGAFTGNFDGNHHGIKNLYINRDEMWVGLFGKIDGAEIYDLGLENAEIIDEDYYFSVYELGTLVGKAEGGSQINNCYATGNIKLSSNYSERIGGLIGSLDHSIIENCYAQVDTETEYSENVGGMVGDSYTSIIRNSYAKGTIIGMDNVGGLVGLHAFGEIQNCYAVTDVNATESSAGGLTGVHTVGTIQNSYTAGSVIGAKEVGGLAGNVDVVSGGKIINNIAFTKAIGAEEDFSLNRIIGYSMGSDSVYNYANENMKILQKLMGLENPIELNLDDTEKGMEKENGGDITANEFKDENFYNNPSKWRTDDDNALWDFENTWEIKEGADRPTLKGVGEDDGKLQTEMRR